jgi:hypothetical protein
MNKSFDRKTPKRLLLNDLNQVVSQSFLELNINSSDVSINAVNNLSLEIYTDIMCLFDNARLNVMQDVQTENSFNRRLFIKQSGNFVNLLGEAFKIKIFLGQTKFIARESFLMAKNKFPDYFERFLIAERNRDSYRIEIYSLVTGLSIEDLFKKDLSPIGIMNHDRYTTTSSEILNNLKKAQKKEILKDKNIDVIFDSFLKYLQRVIISTDEDGYLFYPNDFNIGNFVFDDTRMYEFPNNLINIDYDHMVAHPYRQMVHNAIWGFVSRIYNKEQLPDHLVDDIVLEYRNSKNLVDEVDRLKKQFLTKIGIEYDINRDRFEYPITLHMLNNDKALYDEIHSKRENVLDNLSELEQEMDKPKEEVND